MSSHGRLALLLSIASLLSGQTNAPKAASLIVPGLRVGPVSQTSTELSLLQSLGRVAIKENVGIGEGICEPGLVIYKDDPTLRLAVVWNNNKPAHPASVWICYEQLGEKCRWHTSTGIGFGTTLKDLERRNGKPFHMTGFGFDLGGNIISFEGGKLARELTGLLLTLGPQNDEDGEYFPKVTQDETSTVQGDKIISSNDPVMQKLNPQVIYMRLDLDNTSFVDGIPCRP